MKLTLKAVSITGYGGGITNEDPSLRVVFKCPLNQTIAKTLGVRETLYSQNGSGKGWLLNLFEKTELKGRIDEARIRLSPSGDEQFDTLIDADVDDFVAVNDDGAAILKFRVNTVITNKLMTDYIADQRKEPAESITIEAKQGNLFVEEAVAEPAQKTIAGTEAE